jgi:hypothetical protein
MRRTREIANAAAREYVGCQSAMRQSDSTRRPATAVASGAAATAALEASAPAVSREAAAAWAALVKALRAVAIRRHTFVGRGVPGNAFVGPHLNRNGALARRNLATAVSPSTVATVTADLASFQGLVTATTGMTTPTSAGGGRSTDISTSAAILLRYRPNAGLPARTR